MAIDGLDMLKDPSTLTRLQAPDPTSTTPRSARVDLKDPIQIHLLTETALSDSKEYEILSQEEVDDLKKEAALLSQRVESTRSNLAIQSKYRDAAASMARLGRGEGPDQERERIECERKCDELASTLLSLEKRLLVPHQKILEHTAAILQLTHKASRRKTSPQYGQVVNGIPGSPESLYTYSQSRNSLDQFGAAGSDDAYFGDSALYQLDESERARKNAIEIPLKSPIREQNQLRVELDRLREENADLRSQTDGLLTRLQRLSSSLRDTIVRFNPEGNRRYEDPPRLVSASSDVKLADLLLNQVEYLESGLVAVQAEQDSAAGSTQIGERLEDVNLQLRELLMVSDAHYTPAVLPSDSDVPGQLAYLEESIRFVEAQLSGSGSTNTNDETDSVLENLWESLQRGFAEARQRQEERWRTRGDKGLAEQDEDGLTEDETFDTTESYSLSSFAARVKWLNAQAMTLRDEKQVLKRQVKQQRDLNNKSDAAKDEELSRKQQELEQSRTLLSRAEQDAKDAQKLLSDTMTDLEEARKAVGAAGAARADVEQRNAKIADLEKNLKAAQTSLAAAESGSKGAEGKLAEINARVASLTKEKKAADEAAQKFEKELAAKTKQMKIKEDEVEQLNMTIAELKTEVTIAKAELDGAYGSRAERAAEMAAVKSSSEVLKLQNQVDRLKKELSATVEELEGVTKETIGSEKEKADVEAKLDEALAARSTLETELQKARDKTAKLQEELDAERLKIRSDAAARPGAGASMLSERFRATMREERKKFQEDLKVS